MAKITPHVFISATSGDLRSARDIVKNSLLTIGCHPIVQEHFEPDYRTIKDMLREMVADCEAVIHLVGFHYGGEPDPASLPPGTGRRSWTQLELDVARELGKKVYLFIFDKSYPFDEPTQPDPDDELSLQEVHRQRIFNGEYIYHIIKSPVDLSRRVIELRLEAAELREQVEKSNNQLSDALGTMEKNAGELKEGQVSILSSVAEMRDAFSVYSELGGIIPDPTLPEHFYYNAKISELKGDYGNARKYFIEYFRFDIECIDPHLLFIQFLKVQEGKEGAAETYRHVVRNSKSVVHELAEALLWDRERRIAQLQIFLKSHRDCGPAIYLLSLEFSETRLGTRTLQDKRNEKRFLESFRKFDELGHVVKWFVDQSLVSEWRDDATYRLTALQKHTSALEHPVQVPWLSHNRGWVGTIQIAEIATEIYWRPPDKEKFVSTGFLSTRCYSTGQKLPQQTIELPKVTEKTAIEVAYKNLNGEMMGPYPAMLEPYVESHSETKQILNISKRSWATFREYDGKLLLYFTHLLCHRGGLQQITYGLNSNPRFRVVFPEYNKPGIAPIDSDLPVFITVPPDTTYVTVQVIFKDGAPSEIVKIDRNH
ncbi:MAG: DUF4062 domain-containing protein [Verrucomicrobiales bacterium]|nr:DUF4062 domain-containing protein [Verrucomicrobiales bacterium]